MERLEHHTSRSNLFFRQHEPFLLEQMEDHFGNVHSATQLILLRRNSPSRLLPNHRWDHHKNKAIYTVT